MEVHGTVFYESQRPPEVPAFVKNHGLLPQPEFQQLLRKAKVSPAAGTGGAGHPHGAPSVDGPAGCAHGVHTCCWGKGACVQRATWTASRGSPVDSGILRACGSQPGRAPGRSECGVPVCGVNGHGPLGAAEMGSDAS